MGHKMVYISDLANLKAQLIVVNAKYDMESKEASLNLSYTIGVANMAVNRIIPMVISLDKSSLTSFETAINSKTEKLEQALNRVKVSIEPLLKITKYVDIDLNQVADQLLMEVEGKTGREPKGTY